MDTQVSISTYLKNISTHLNISSFPAHLAEARGRACVGYLRAQLGPGSAGVPSTLARSGQQWDLPNLWPPLEHLVITGLYTSGCQEAREEARRLARARVEHCLNIYQTTGHMFEKVGTVSSFIQHK